MTDVSIKQKQKMLQDFRNWLKVLDSLPRNDSRELVLTTRQERQKFNKAKNTIASYDHAIYEALLVEEGMITLNNSCAKCSNCWIPTDKARQ